MRRILEVMSAGLALAFVVGSANAQAPIGRWNLGEQDPGASAGSPGNTDTLDAIGKNKLTATGAPSYSANVPAGGSTLSMSFDGASFYQGSWAGNGAELDMLYATNDWNNFSLSCDIYVNALGAGFSFPLSLGRNGAGFGLVEISGKWHVLHFGVAASAPGPDVVLNTWTHLDLVRKYYGSSLQTRLYINGAAEPAITFGERSVPPTDFLTIGANQASTVPGTVEGYFSGLVDNVVLTNLSLNAPPGLTGITASPGTVYTGNSIILTAAGISGDTAGRRLLWRKAGTVIGTGTTVSFTITNVTVANSGNYDLVVTNNFGAVTSAVVSVTVMDASYSGGADAAKYRLGDNDPGAVVGSPGNLLTKDALGTNDLTAFGSVSYSGDVPAGGGAFSMMFDGATGYYQSINLADLYDKLDFNNFSLSCDVYVNALGASGFSFPISMGGQNGGGFSVVEIGGSWYLLHQLVAQSAVGFPVVLNQWTHLELQRRQFGSTVSSRLFVNGVDIGAEIVSGPTLPIHPNLTIGANARADEVSVEGPFNGLIDNVVVYDYSVGAKPKLIAEISAEPGTILLAGESLTLAASAQGGSPLTFNWRKNGVVFASTVGGPGGAGSTTLASVAPTDAGDYDVVVTNLLGSATSKVIKVSVFPAGSARPIPTVKYRLGEDDSGAAAGAPGNATSKPTAGSLALTATGSPLYSATVPAGGSTLSMSFNGADSFYQASGDALAAFISTLDYNHFSLSCDAYIMAPGTAGFSFPLSIGANAAGGGGLAIVEVGGLWYVIHQGQELSAVGPAVAYNTWTHLQLLRRNFGSGLETRLFIDGIDAGISLKSTPAKILPYLTVGGNVRGDLGMEGYFNGIVDNVEVLSYTSPAAGLSLAVKAGKVDVSSQGRPGTYYTLWRAGSLTGSWERVAGGFSDSGGNLTLNDPAPLPGSAFYRTTAP